MSASGHALAPAAEVAEAALRAATGECVVIVEERFDANVRFARNSTTTNGVTRDRSVVVVAFSPGDGGTSVGVASRSGGGAVAELVAAAEAAAASAPAAEDAAPLVDGGADASFDEGPADTSLAVFGSLLGDLGEVFASAEAAGHLLAGFAQHDVTTTYLASSAGTRRRHVQPTGSLELVARSGDGTRSSWAARGTPDFSGLSVHDLDATLARRLAWAERKVELPAGRYEVLLPPDAVADLMADLAWAMSGREAEDGGTVFSRGKGRTAIGERLSEIPFRLSSDPSYPGLECAPFLVAGGSSSDVSVFDNGAALAAVAWVEDGRLARLGYHRAGAARSGQRFTPPVDNLILEVPGATADLEELVAGTERALLLTCLWYIREVDPATLLLTGLTRDGVYLVEGGEVRGAVNNFRFNESPVDLLSHTVEAGRTVRALSREWGEYLNRTAMPPLRVADFNMSSVSPAS
ncbi:MAG TPA: metallopeptidase TldD-related protein [Acidimicrobiales bacterium]|nr:metallopeptidase TldD-related protein [Acidimicrobiales bacterium]